MDLKRQYQLAIMDLTGFALLLGDCEDPKKKQASIEVLEKLKDIMVAIEENIL